MKLNTRVHLLPRLRMSGATPLLRLQAYCTQQLSTAPLLWPLTAHISKFPTAGLPLRNHILTKLITTTTFKVVTSCSPHFITLCSQTDQCASDINSVTRDNSLADSWIGNRQICYSGHRIYVQTNVCPTLHFTTLYAVFTNRLSCV